jgi:hypothetical protein
MNHTWRGALVLSPTPSVHWYPVRAKRLRAALIGLSVASKTDWGARTDVAEQLDPDISSGDDHSSSSKHLVCTPHRSTYVISSSASGRSATSWNNLSSLTQFLAMPAVSISS